jgi:dephospho-CoA kinase
LKKIGITGNIGSGKSTITRIFALLGIPIYDADSRAKWLMNNRADLIDGIKEMFGNEAYLSDLSLNRKFIASIAFHDKSKIEALNSLIHPAVAADFLTWSNSQIAPYTIKEAALLIESKSYLDLDDLILVKCPIEIRVERTIKRDLLTRNAVEARINNQMSEEEKIPFSKYFINNDGSELLIPQVLKIHINILEQI